MALGDRINAASVLVFSSGEIGRPRAPMIVRDGMKPNVFGAHVAQLVEHVLGKDEVTRSIRVVGSIRRLSRSAHDMRNGNISLLC